MRLDNRPYVERFIALIKTKYKVPILLALADEPMRFSELTRRLGHETPETGYRRALRELETDGIVSHDRKLYRLAERGRELLKVLDAAAVWAQQEGRPRPSQHDRLRASERRGTG